jgi:hypothetical protein
MGFQFRGTGVEAEVYKIPVLALDVFDSYLILNCFDIQIGWGLDVGLLFRLSPSLQIVCGVLPESL